MLGDLLEVPVNVFSIVACGDANSFEQVIFGAEIQCGSLETVRNIGLRFAVDKSVGDHPGPEVLCGLVVAFVITVCEFDACFFKYFGTQSEGEIGRIDLGVQVGPRQRADGQVRVGGVWQESFVLLHATRCRGKGQDGPVLREPVTAGQRQLLKTVIGGLCERRKFGTCCGSKRTFPVHCVVVALEIGQVPGESQGSIIACVANVEIHFVCDIVERSGQQARLCEVGTAITVDAVVLLPAIVGGKLEAAGWQVFSAKLQHPALTLYVLTCQVCIELSETRSQRCTHPACRQRKRVCGRLQENGVGREKLVSRYLSIRHVVVKGPLTPATQLCIPRVETEILYRPAHSMAITRVTTLTVDIGVNTFFTVAACITEVCGVITDVACAKLVIRALSAFERAEFARPGTRVGFLRMRR